VRSPNAIFRARSWALGERGEPLGRGSRPIEEL